MNILIVSVNQERSPFPVAPIGALCVCTAAERAGHEVDFIDMMFEKDPLNHLLSAIRSVKYNAIGFSIRNLDDCIFVDQKSYFEDVRAMVEFVLNHTEARVILGGSGFSVAPYGWLKRLHVHYGVVGDGEYAFVELIEALESNRSPVGLNGIICNDEEHTDGAGLPKAHSVTDLDSEYWPAHRKCNYKRYLSRGGFVSVQTKRGCPFKCIYCVYPLLEGNEYHLRSPGHIADEVASIVNEVGATSFYFTDSVFNSPRAHTLAISKELKRRRLPIKWMAYCNPIGFDNELARAMTEAGCVGVEFGLDAVTKKMLRMMGKPFTQLDIRSSLKSASDAELPFAIHLLFGGPGESIGDIRETQRFLDSCPEPNAVFALMGIRIYNNTPIEKIALSEGTISTDTDLFNPAYYISNDLGKEPMKTLDEIARERHEWSTPTDWSSIIMRTIQKFLNRTGMHPQWRNIRNYGRYMRR